MKRLFLTFFALMMCVVSVLASGWLHSLETPKSDE